MRDVIGRSTELLLCRDNADTDVSDHRGDVAGREDVARAEMDARCDVSGYSVNVINSGIWPSTEHETTLHVRTTMCELHTSLV